MQDARQVRHPRNPAAVLPVAADLHVHPRDPAGDGIPRSAGRQGRSLEHRRADHADAPATGPGADHSDGAAGRTADRARADVRRPRGRGTPGVRRQPIPIAPARPDVRGRGGRRAPLRDDPRHSGRESDLPPDRLRRRHPAGRERRAPAGVLHQLPELGSVHARHPHDRRRVEGRAGRRNRAARCLNCHLHGRARPAGSGSRQADRGPGARGRYPLFPPRRARAVNGDLPVPDVADGQAGSEDGVLRLGQAAAGRQRDDHSRPAGAGRRRSSQRRSPRTRK